MVRLAGPQDVARTAVRNTRTVVDVAEDKTAENLNKLSRATTVVLNAARDQQIETDVTRAEMQTRRDLDALRVQLDEDPDNSTLTQRWDAGSRDIIARHSETLRSPAHQRAWQERAAGMVETERRGIVAVQQQRVVEGVRAGVLETVAMAQAIMTDENASEAARTQAMATIDLSVRRAVERHVIGADDGARMMAAARASQAEFERTQGAVALVQTEAGQIWGASNGNLDVAIEMARERFSGTIEEDIVNGLRQRFSDERTARTGNVDDAMGRAYQIIEAGRPLSSLSAADRTLIVDAGQMDTLRTYVAARSAGPGGVEAHSRASAAVRDTVLGAAADRARAPAIAEIDLNAPLTEEGSRALGFPVGTNLREALTPDHYNELVARQAELRGEPRADGSPNAIINNSQTQLMDIARGMAASLQIDLPATTNGTAEGSAEARRRLAALEAYLYSELRAYVQTNHAAPSVPDMQAMARSAFTQSSASVGMFNTVRRRRFEASPSAFVRVPYANILPAQRERLARAWARAGHTEPPTPAQIAAMYSEEIAGLSE